MNQLSPFFVALDLDSLDDALKIARECKGFAAGFKIGPRLCLQADESFYRELSSCGPLFIDHKFFDIPNTMMASVEACFRLGASFVTVHASAGKKALQTLASLERHLSAQRPFQILAVTVLTSFDREHIPSNWKSQNIRDHVSDLVNDCKEAGLSGLVCSGHEVAEIRKLWPEAYLLVPGVRLSEDTHHDQARVGRPSSVLNAGATALVVGRPIVESRKPAEALERYIRSLSEDTTQKSISDQS